MTAGESNESSSAEDVESSPQEQRSEETLTEWMRRELSKIPRCQLSQVKVRVVDLDPGDR